MSESESKPVIDVYAPLLDEIAIEAAESTDFTTWCLQIIARLGSFVTEDALLINIINQFGS
jgi:hypothetical protein